MRLSCKLIVLCFTAYAANVGRCSGDESEDIEDGVRILEADSSRTADKVVINEQIVRYVYSACGYINIH